AQIPTPNPIVNETIFNFSLRKKQNITLYISPSKSLKKSSFKDFGVKNTFQFGADRIMIINSDLFDEGMHSISFDLRTLSNSNIPNGLYRLYLKTEDNYYWQDVMISK
ncbi:MAG: hypothetical protein NTW25_01245, partial [Candidatus Kapabacteria bacterium]|nr:hypothetical protein [Candidatus Kapabacteria bacterium]